MADLSVGAGPRPARSLRISLTGASAGRGIEAVVVDPPDVATGRAGPEAPDPSPSLLIHDSLHATLCRSDGRRSRLLLLPAQRAASSGSASREVVIDGWRFEVEVEDAHRAALRERASHGQQVDASSPQAEVRAIIPGRIASVAVVAGQAVSAGEPLLVIEAMKMQNELRAPRAGTVGTVQVTAGATVDAGDLLAVIE